jgi:hypothetical protein
MNEIREWWAIAREWLVSAYEQSREPTDLEILLGIIGAIAAFVVYLLVRDFVRTRRAINKALAHEAARTLHPAEIEFAQLYAGAQWTPEQLASMKRPPVPSADPPVIGLTRTAREIIDEEHLSQRELGLQAGKPQGDPNVVEDMAEDEAIKFMRPETDSAEQRFREASEHARINYRTEHSIHRPIWGHPLCPGMIQREYMPANDVLRVWMNTNNTAELRRLFQLEMG